MKSIEQEFDDQEILAAASIPLRAQDLRDAEKLTCGDRNASYGDPVDNMTHIAEIFNAITGRDLQPEEVPLFHIAVKLARLRTSPGHRDSVVDAMAYLGIYHECATTRRIAGLSGQAYDIQAAACPQFKRFP
jgi:hypothetical protein